MPPGSRRAQAAPPPRPARPLAVLASAVGALWLAACSPSAQATVYYVDYGAGSDSASGKAPDKAWRHAPGDPLATDAPKAAQLAPGDTVRFKGGVVYRGSIVLKADGAEGAPITYAGDAWGDRPAVFDGSDPVVSVAPCPSAEACGQAANWNQLSLVEFTPPKTKMIKFFDGEGMLYESQFPRAKDPFFSDDIADYVEIPEGDYQRGQAGEIQSAKLAKALERGGGGAELSIWARGNRVTRRPITAIEGDVLRFAPNGLQLYDDRPGKAAVANAAGLIDAPGFYAVIAPGRAVAWLRPGGGGLVVGSGRGGFDIKGRSDVAIRGFLFQHYSAGKYGEGVQVTNSGTLARRVLIAKNVFRRSALYTGAGAIMIGKVDGAEISGNTFADIERGSGIRTNAKPVSNLRIVGNRFERLGQTGILVMSSTDVLVSKNVMTGLKGIHGNGISIYLENRRVTVSDNRILDSDRPMTFHGEDPVQPGDHDLVIQRNLFSATGPASSAPIISFGKVRGVTISDNVLVGRRFGMLLSPKDQRVTVSDNRTTAIEIKGERPADWVVKNNKPPSRAETHEAAAAPTSD